MGEFPAQLFRLEGDPGAIRSSASQWSAFGTAASEAAGQVTALDTSQFVGPEGDLFRDGLNESMPEHLRITGDAFGMVAGALSGFAGSLSQSQEQMRPLAGRAPGLWEALQQAQGRVGDAQGADQAHDRQVAATPADQPAAPDAYRSDAAAAGSALSSAQRAWQDCVDAANGVRSSMVCAVDACVRVVDEATGMRFKENPKWYDLGGQFTNFVRDNKELLQQLSGALKIVSLVAGVLSFVPFLAPVMAPLALGTALAASAIDLSIYAATGQGSLSTILIDVGLNVLPGVGKLARMGMARYGDDVARIGLSSSRPMGSRAVCGDPVDAATGEMVLAQSDIELDGAFPLLLTRAHVSSYRVGRWFGGSWASTLDQRLEVGDSGIYYAAEDGMLLRYPPLDSDTRDVDTRDVSVLPEEGPRWPLTRTDDGGYAVTVPERGHTLHFPPAGAAQQEVLPLTVVSLGVVPLGAISDRNGHRIDLDYDTGGMLTQVRHSGGYRIGVETTGGLITALRLLDGDGRTDVAIVRYGYDKARRLTEVINSSGRPLRFDYDTAGRITRWRDRNGVWFGYAYDEHGRCVRTSGADGFMNGQFAYDPDRLVTVYMNSLGHATEFHLNEAGQVIREVDPLGHTTVSEWDRYDHLLGRIDPLGRSTRYGYDEAGNLIAVTRPDGTQTVAEYNELRLPVTVADPDGAVWRREYDGRGNLTAVTDPLDATTRYAYDKHGHLVTVTDALGQLRRIETNAAGLPTAVTNPLGAITYYVRDGFGRVSAIIDPVDGVTRLGWTIEGKPAWRTLPDGATERWSYDGEGNLIQYVDALGQVTRTEVTHFDLPATQTGPDGARLAFSYDTELRLVAVTNPQGLVWRYDYDPVGTLVRETDFNGRVLAYSHDDAGQLVERTNGAGQTIRYTRDPLGNVVEQRSGAAVTTFGYDAAGRMVRAVNVDAEVSFERDPLGRVVAENCNGRTLTSSFDPLGRRVRRRTPSGARSCWEFDAGNQPVALHTAGRTVRFGYDAAGREIERHLGAGATMAQAWDTNHRLRSQTVTATGTVGDRPASAGQARLVQRRSYRYRADGYLTAIIDQLSGPREFDLDPVGRVTAVRAAGWAERYAYDPAGNVTNAAWPVPERTDSPDGDACGEREYAGTLIRRAGNVRYQHDAQGRIIQRQQKRLSAKPRTWRYTWDTEDHLLAVTTPDGQRWRYSYDPLGRRIAKERLADDHSVAERVEFTWDGPVLAEQTHTGLPAGPRTTVWDWEPGSFRPVAQTERAPLREAPQDWVDERFYAIVTDLVGTPTELLDPDGTLAWRAHTTLWGALLTPTLAGADTPLRFPGQYHDPETGLNYNYHRYYDPTTARYETNDPLGLAPGPNPCSYVLNPTGWLDPLGLMGCRPPNLSPPGAGRRGAFRQAKRDAGIPVSQQPDRVTPNIDRRGDVQPGRTYEYNVPAEGGGTQTVGIRDDSGGHVFPDDPLQNRGPHFNTEDGGHYDY